VFSVLLFDMQERQTRKEGRGDGSWSVGELLTNEDAPIIPAASTIPIGKPESESYTISKL